MMPFGKCAIGLSAFFLASCSLDLQEVATAAAARTTVLNDCEIFHDDLANDVIVHRCEGLGQIPVWFRYSDSARLYVGFGAKQHDSGIFGLNGDPEPTLEWRGIESPSGFVPHAVIVRLPQPIDGNEASFAPSLAVFRLRGDGTSCRIGSQIGDERLARQIADAAAQEFTCEFEPYVYDTMQNDVSP